MNIVNKSNNVGQAAVQSYDIANINVTVLSRFYILYNLLLSNSKVKVKKYKGILLKCIPTAMGSTVIIKYRPK